MLPVIAFVAGFIFGLALKGVLTRRTKELKRSIEKRKAEAEVKIDEIKEKIKDKL